MDDMDNLMHPMWEHINASLEDKVNALSENPYRYYIGQNVWVFRKSRQEILEEYLKTAIANEKYELCQKIHEVKSFLNIINGHPTERDSILVFETKETIFELKVRYYLKKENQYLKLYYNIQKVVERKYPCESIPIDDTIRKSDVINLLKHLFSSYRVFDGLPLFSRLGLLDEKDFNFIITEIKNKVRSNDKKAQILRTPFIDFLESKSLNPIPQGSNDTNWLAKCPYSKGNHFMMVSTITDTFGCGWCKKKGNQKDLEQFINKNQRI